MLCTHCQRYRKLFMRLCSRCAKTLFADLGPKSFYATYGVHLDGQKRGTYLRP